MTGRDLGKADFAGHVGHKNFVFGVQIGMQTGNGD